MEHVHDVAIIGGGLAGTSIAFELNKCGLQSLIIERGTSLASGASGNDQGLIIPYLTAAETSTQNLYEEAFQIIEETLPALFQEGLLPSLRNCGAIQFASSLRPQKIHEALKSGSLVNHRTHRISSVEISTLLRTEVSSDALFFPDAFVLSPPELCHGWVTKSHAKIIPEKSAITISHDGSLWEIFAHQGVSIAKAQFVVIANAFDCVQFVQTSWLKVEKIRGQILTLPVDEKLKHIATALCFDGYFLPEYKNSVLLGASYDHTFLDPHVSIERTLDMVGRFKRRFPLLQLPPLESGTSRVSFRTSTHDRLPYVGQVPDFEWAKREKPLWARLKEGDVPMIQNLFVSVGHGSRGLLSAPLSAKLIASAIAKNNTTSSVSLYAPLLSPKRLLERMIKREEFTR